MDCGNVTSHFTYKILTQIKGVNYLAKNVSDEKLLESLLLNGSVQGASADCKISQSAIYKRLQNPDFRKKYDQLQGLVLSAVAGSLTQSLNDAVGCLQSVINDKNVAATVKVSASDALLRHCCRYVETSNILSRIERLENQTDYSV